MRVISNDFLQGDAIKQLLLHHEWVHIGVIRSDDAYGQNALVSLDEAFPVIVVDVTLKGAPVDGD